MQYTLTHLPKALVDRRGSDLHVAPYSPPRLRLSGSLLPLDVPPLSPEQATMLCFSVLTEDQKKTFQMRKELDMAFGVKDLARFRGNIYVQKGSAAGVFRLIPNTIPSLDALGLPPIFKRLSDLPRGMILITGQTGSGKSTTLAAMVDYINTTHQGNIMTIEDPVEYVHPHKYSMVNQREVGADTDSFANALKHVLRQDPDVIMVGEMRDLETISLALTAAETGHLVLGTLHTNSAVSSLYRIIDVFPEHRQGQVRAQLALSLNAVVCQALLPGSDNSRALAMEILIPHAGIRNLIRENKIHQIYSSMQTGQDESGMQTLNQSLAVLTQKGLISQDVALSVTPDEAEYFEILARGRGGVVGKPSGTSRKK